MKYRGLLGLAVILAVLPVLPQPVLDASDGLLAYDDTAKTLSVSGLLTGAAEAAIAAAAAVSTSDSADNVAAGEVTLTPASMTNIAPGAVLVIDSGAAQETVVVASVTATTFTTTTALPHDGSSTPFPIVSDPSLPAALAALAAASQQAVAPFFAKYQNLQGLYTNYMTSTDPLPARRQTLLASFLPTLIQLRKVEQALAEITAQIGCDPSFAQALLQDAAIMHADADPAEPAVADLGYPADQRLVATVVLGLKVLADAIDELETRISLRTEPLEIVPAQDDAAGVEDLTAEIHDITEQVGKLAKLIEMAKET